MAQLQETENESIIKASFLWVKNGLFVGSYKERLFELKSISEFKYFEISNNGEKIERGTINLSPNTIIYQRKNIRTQYKFVIKTGDKEWYLWCKGHNASSEYDEWMNSINNTLQSPQLQCINHTNDNNNISQLRTYYSLIHMGFDKQFSIEAARKYPKKIDNATNYITNTYNQQMKEFTNDCLINKCSSLNALVATLQFYDNNYSNKKLIKQLYDKFIDDILNDFQHILMKHNHQFHEIYNHIFKNNLLSQCNEPLKCDKLKRNQRDRSREKNDEKYNIDNTSNELMFLTDTMDSIHSYFLHSYHMGFRLNINNDKNNSFSSIKNLLNSKRKQLQNIRGGNKFIFQNKFQTEINEKEILNRGHNESQYRFGRRFYYSKNQISFQQKWFIDVKYSNLKNEILFNKICCINKHQYDMIILKAKHYIKSNESKKLMMRQDIFEEAANKRFGRIKLGSNNNIGTAVKLDSLISLILYCDYKNFSYQLNLSFHKIKHGETDNSLKQRHSEFFHVAKRLCEIVQCFGTVTTKDISYYHSSSYFMFLNGLFQLNAPISTSTEISVCVIFAKYDGIILDFQANYGWISGFNCSWISNFTFENEILFFGG
eukprot:501416_1